MALGPGRNRDKSKIWIAVEPHNWGHDRSRVRFWIEREEVVTLMRRGQSPYKERVPRKVNKSEVEFNSWDACSGALIHALANDEIVGKSATGAVHTLFWECMVQRDEGLDYLYKYCPKSGIYYARFRADVFASKHENCEGLQIVHTSYHKLDFWESIHPRRCLTFYEQVTQDRDLADAIVAVREADGGEGSNNWTETEKFLRQHLEQDNDANIERKAHDR
jgi:hypothetical protein